MRSVDRGRAWIKRHGVYYLMYSGASAQSPDYAIGYTTATSPLGPFEKYAGNPIVHRAGNVLGPGHPCVIVGPDGRLWLVYHQKWNAASNFKRFLAIDPMWFDDRGVIHARPSRDTDEPRREQRGRPERSGAREPKTEDPGRKSAGPFDER